MNDDFNFWHQFVRLVIQLSLDICKVNAAACCNKNSRLCILYSLYSDDNHMIIYECLLTLGQVFR